MRTRSGCTYKISAMAMDWKETKSAKKRKSPSISPDFVCHFKSSVKRRISGNNDNETTQHEDETTEQEGFDCFDELPDDLIVSIMSKLSSSALSPADLFNARLTCKRLNKLGQDSFVLARASAGTLAVQADKWCESAHQFLHRCCDAGNTEASYILGMIRFYCLEKRASGGVLMVKAALKSHPSALYSLAIIQFNGSGGSTDSKKLTAGATLCARAATLGHIDALIELGHCLEDGYGVQKNAEQGRRLIVQGNTREAATLLSLKPHEAVFNTGMFFCPPDQANRFLIDWFALQEDKQGLGLNRCSYEFCGRMETRKHEFRRCSICSKVNYCSRTCQARDWRREHKLKCTPNQFVWGPHAGNINLH